MGLDFSHCNANWSYSGFDDFRHKIANEIKMNLDEMEGFGGERKFSDFNDDIVPLIDHLDCDGELSPDQCRKIAPRLRELVKDWSNNDYDKVAALDLAEGMELAAKKSEHLQFR